MRKAKRTAIYIPCTLQLSAEEHYSGSFIDLSSAGGLCQVKRKGNSEIPNLKIGQPIELSCLLPGLPDEQKIKGLVRNFKRSGSEALAGIEFVELAPYLKETIERYLDSFENDTQRPFGEKQGKLN